MSYYFVNLKRILFLMKSSWKVDLLCCSEYCFKIIVMIFSYIREIDSFTSTLPPCHIVPNITYPFTLSSFLKNAEKGDPGNVTYSQRNILVNFHENELFSLFTYNTQLRISSLMWYMVIYLHTHTHNLYGDALLCCVVVCQIYIIYLNFARVFGSTVVATSNPSKFYA